MKVGIVVHGGRDESVAAATEAVRGFHDLGVDVTVAAADPSEAHPVQLDGAAPTVAPDDGFLDGLDLAISFGGDGTFLRAAHLCRDPGIPVLGVNLGRLGFLAEVELDDLGPALRAVAAGEFSVEERPTLEVVIHDADGAELSRAWALNEVAVEKTVRQRLLLVDVHIDNTLFAQVPADALIIATATGSTAYALSAGGPIVSPRVDATLVVPVAPHSLFDRTVLAGPGEWVRVDLASGQPPALVSCDGRHPVEVGPGGGVSARGGGEPVRIARVGVSDFYSLVRRKFGLR